MTSEVYGEGVGQVWLENLACGTDAKNLMTDCGITSFGSDCSHQKDIGIKCGDFPKYGEYNQTIYLIMMNVTRQFP